jgi:rubrerythrin
VRSFPYENEVYVGRDLTDATLVDNLLKTEGIDAIIAPPKTGSRALRSVYVLDRAHMARARAIVERYRRGEPLVDPKTVKSWRCRTCNELIEGQFDVCWKCGRRKLAI